MDKLTRTQIAAARPLLADVWATGLHGITGRELDEGTLAAGTLVTAIATEQTEDGPLTRFAASTDGGASWHWQETFARVEVRS